MNVHDLIALAMTFVGSLLGSWALLLPFFDSSEPEMLDDQTAKEQLRAKLLRKDALLTSLAEIEEDVRSGKISDTEYSLTKNEMMLEATELEADIDELESRPAKSKKAPAPIRKRV